MKTIKRLVQTSMLAGLLLAVGCEESKFPKVSTVGVSPIFERSAKSGGMINAEGDSPVISKGVCWSSSAGPTIADSKTDEGSGGGRFESILTGLTPTTTYFLRAYATNSSGTGYGNETKFTTRGDPLPPATGTIADQTGNIYVTRKIGRQIWMTEDVKAKVFRDGSAIPFMRADTWFNLTTPATCWVQNDDSWTTFFGQFYNFYAVTDPRGICPTGWHVPSLPEWEEMIDSLGGNAVAGGKLKEIGNRYWITPNEDASNSSGFTGLAAGIRDQLKYMDFRVSGYYWTSTSPDGTFGVIESLRYSTGSVNASQFPKTAGASLRCVQD